jgi:hypothetical protein
MSPTLGRRIWDHTGYSQAKTAQKQRSESHIWRFRLPVYIEQVDLAAPAEMFSEPSRPASGRLTSFEARSVEAAFTAMGETIKEISQESIGLR